jgi:SWI/SNF-related matrix-associated actin-dependent regulator of chromatin subfamily D
LHIELDPALFPDDGFTEWTKIHLSAETDGFEIKRKFPLSTSSPPAPIAVKIFVQIDHGCDKFTLSPALQSIVNKQFDSKPQLIMGIWQYVKMHKLQDPEDKRVIRCDETLKAAFEKDSITFSALPDLLATHLSPLGPLKIDYQISADISESNPDEFVTLDPLVLDLEVETEDTSRGRLPTILASSAMTKEIGLFDQKISELLMHIHRSCLRMEFLKKFHQDPVAFINQWVVSQASTLEELLGPMRPDDTEEHRLSEFFSQPWLHDWVASGAFE